MKNIVSIIFLLLACVVPTHSVVPRSQSASGSSVISNPVPAYALEMVGWAEWIQLPRRRRRPWRPLLPRKMRRRIQLQLRRIYKRQRRLALKSQRERANQKSSRNKKVLLVLAGAVIALLLLSLTVSAWLGVPRQCYLRPYVWAARSWAPFCPIAVAGVAGSDQKAVVYG